MSEEQLPAVRDEALGRYARLGQWLQAAEVADPNEKQLAMAAALRIYYADALELPPLAAAELSVIRGRLVVSAKLLRALAVRGGYRVVKAEVSETSCTARLLERDTGELIGETTFTIEDARRAGLIREKGSWKTHPARMLWARASKFVIDDYAPEVSLGLQTDEEVAEIEGEAYEEPEPSPMEKFAQAEGPYPYPEGTREFTSEPPGPEEQATVVMPPGERGESG